MTSLMRRIKPFLVLTLLLPVLIPLRGDAHEIPTEVVVQSYVKPEGSELKLLVRVPLEAMRDVVFPLRGPGFLDLDNIDETLHDAATIWIANEVELYEDGVQVDTYTISAVRLSLPSRTVRSEVMKRRWRT